MAYNGLRLTLQTKRLIPANGVAADVPASSALNTAQTTTTATITILSTVLWKLGDSMG